MLISKLIYNRHMVRIMRERIYPQAGLRQYKETCKSSSPEYADTAPPMLFERLLKLGRAALNRLITSKHSNRPSKSKYRGRIIIPPMSRIPESIRELKREYYDEEEQNE